MSAFACGSDSAAPDLLWTSRAEPGYRRDSEPDIVSGRMRVVLDDGAEAEVGPGDVVGIPPGHDAEVIGDEPCVMVDLADMGDSDYAKG